MPNLDVRVRVRRLLIAEPRGLNSECCVVHHLQVPCTWALVLEQHACKKQSAVFFLSHSKLPFLQRTDVMAFHSLSWKAQNEPAALLKAT